MADSSSLGLSPPPHHISLDEARVQELPSVPQWRERDDWQMVTDKDGAGGVKEKCATQSQNLLTWWERVVEKTVSCSQKRDINYRLNF